MFVVSFALESCNSKDMPEKPLLLTLKVETKGSGCVLTNKTIDLSEFVHAKSSVEKIIAMSSSSNATTLRGGLFVCLLELCFKFLFSVVVESKWLESTRVRASGPGGSDAESDVRKSIEDEEVRRVKFC